MTEMQSQFPSETLDRMKNCGVIAALVVDDANNIVPLSRALVACGIDCIELALQTSATIDALRLVREQVPEMIVGVSTILQPDQVDEVVSAGARFGAAPGLNLRVVERAKEKGLPLSLIHISEPTRPY